jgi:hypothetical protein
MKRAGVKLGDARRQNPALAPRESDPAWLAQLRARCARSSIVRMARELGYTPQRLSQVLSGRDRYMRHIEERFAKLAQRDARAAASIGDSSVLRRNERCAGCPITSAEDDIAARGRAPLEAARSRLAASLACLNRFCSIERRPG